MKYTFHDLWAGNKEAYRELIENYEREIVRRFLSKYRLSKQEKEDILQDLLIRLVKYFKNSNFNDQDHFYKWVGKVVASRAVDYFRKAKKEVHIKDPRDFEKLACKEVQTSNNQENHEGLIPENVTQAKEAIMSLDDKKRKLLVLRYYNCYTEKEIADIIKKPVGTVKSSLSRIRKELKKYMMTNKIKLRE